jgi:hypothetical protein
MGVCLLSSFLLFRTKYVRYLKAIWCMFFMRIQILDFKILRLVGFLDGMFVYGSSYPDCDGDERIYFSYVIL